MKEVSGLVDLGMQEKRERSRILHHGDYYNIHRHQL